MIGICIGNFNLYVHSLKLRPDQPVFGKVTGSADFEIQIHGAGEFVAIADDFNNLVSELGYQNISFSVWKETREGQYKYIFESNWPDQETYDKVHEYEEFKVVWKKNYAKWKRMAEEDVYNRYIPLN